MNKSAMIISALLLISIMQTGCASSKINNGTVSTSSAQTTATPQSNNLGSNKNPVKVNMPGGEHAYLNRLRCQNGVAPTYYRIGNVGVGVFGNIVDNYSVSCENSEPRQSNIYMDMYFPTHNETRAPQGFTLVPQ